MQRIDGQTEKRHTELDAPPKNFNGLRWLKFENWLANIKKLFAKILTYFFQTSAQINQMDKNPNIDMGIFYKFYVVQVLSYYILYKYYKYNHMNIQKESITRQEKPQYEKLCETSTSDNKSKLWDIF